MAQIPGGGGILGKGPKARICYICGRQYGLSSYHIHEKQCKELWIAREEQKPLKERKPLPPDPTLSASASNEFPSITGTPRRSLTLDETNALAQTAFNTVALEKCPYCGRTFLAEKLVIHNRSCTADKPARRLDESVRRGKSVEPTGMDSEHSSLEKSSPSKGIASAKPLEKKGSKMSESMNPTSNRATTSLQPRNSADKNDAKSHIRDSHNDNDDKLEFLNRKVETLESTIFEMGNTIEEMKEEIEYLKAALLK